VAKEVVRRKLSVRQTEAWMGRCRLPKVVTKADPDVLRLQTELSDKLGAKVQILHKGQGRIVIHYNDVNELEGILAHFR